MAQIIQHPSANVLRVIQTRKPGGSYPKGVISLHMARRARIFAKYDSDRLKEEISEALAAATEWERVGLGLRLKAEALKQRARSTK